jgi:hypothetical protein
MASPASNKPKRKKGPSGAKSASSGRSWLVLSRSPFRSITTVAFAVLFVAVGGYFLYNSSRAASSYVELRIGNLNGYCVDSSNVENCQSSNPNRVWNYMSGTFAIKSEAGECLDDWNGAVQTKTGTANRVYVHYTSCYGDNNQKWHWNGSRIQSNASGGCLNGLGGTTSPGTQLGVYSCNSGSNELFYETSVSVASTPPAGGGGGGGGGAYSCAGYNRNYVLTTEATGAMCASANKYMAQYGMDSASQMQCLSSVWNWESNWNPSAQNPTSPAYGIPQADPGDKMASAGADWRTNPDTQIKWGVGYVAGTYSKNACNAWYSETHNGGYVKIDNQYF